MTAVKKTVRKIILKQLIYEANGNTNKAISELKSELSNYTDSKFEDKSWKIKTKKANDFSISFNNYDEYGSNILELIKIFVIIRLLENRSDFSLVKELKSGLEFLKIASIEIHHLSKQMLITHFVAYLSEKATIETVKKRQFNTFRIFLYCIQGHPYAPIIPGIELVDNPYKGNAKDGYKVIDSITLDFLDKHFSHLSTPLHYKTVYWILRLFATRPEETLNYPLNCVEKLNDEIAMMRVYIGKKAITAVNEKNEKSHNFLYLDLNNSHMKSLYTLILEQQNIAKKLQIDTDKKGYLFTYIPISGNGGKHVVRILSTRALAVYLKKIQRDNGIQESKRARPRDFKKTGITQRSEWGFNSFDLKRMANHKGFESLDSYSAPSKKFLIEKQQKVLSITGDFSERYIAKGKIIHGIDDMIERKIMTNPRAHKLPGMGYCADVNHCGNHFECLGCKYLIPEKELEDYYYEQAMVYLEKAKNQEKIRDNFNAKDSLYRATLFHDLWQRVRKNHGKR